MFYDTSRPHQLLVAHWCTAQGCASLLVSSPIRRRQAWFRGADLLTSSDRISSKPLVNAERSTEIGSRLSRVTTQFQRLVNPIGHRVLRYMFVGSNFGQTVIHIEVAAKSGTQLGHAGLVLGEWTEKTRGELLGRIRVCEKEYLECDVFVRHDARHLLRSQADQPLDCLGFGVTAPKALQSETRLSHDHESIVESRDRFPRLRSPRGHSPPCPHGLESDRQHQRDRHRPPVPQNCIDDSAQISRRVRSAPGNQRHMRTRERIAEHFLGMGDVDVVVAEDLVHQIQSGCRYSRSPRALLLDERRRSPSGEIIVHFEEQHRDSAEFDIALHRRKQTGRRIEQTRSQYGISHPNGTQQVVESHASASEVPSDLTHFGTGEGSTGLLQPGHQHQRAQCGRGSGTAHRLHDSAFTFEGGDLLRDSDGDILTDFDRPRHSTASQRLPDPLGIGAQPFGLRLSRAHPGQPVTPVRNFASLRSTIRDLHNASPHWATDQIRANFLVCSQ